MKRPLLSLITRLRSLGPFWTLSHQAKDPLTTQRSEIQAWKPFTRLGGCGAQTVLFGFSAVKASNPAAETPYPAYLRRMGPAVLVFLATVAAYLSSLSGEFIWNDSDYVTAPALRSLAGLGRIWTETGATQQYYPLLHSAFWIEHVLWGDHPLGYHAFTVLLHALAAVLFARVLRRLLNGASSFPPASVPYPGAEWLAALIFALHPVHVESVAWISEQKNTLSLVFYLAAALAYLRFDEDRRPGDILQPLPSSSSRSSARRSLRRCPPPCWWPCGGSGDGSAGSATCGLSSRGLPLARPPGCSAAGSSAPLAARAGRNLTSHSSTGSWSPDGRSGSTPAGSRGPLASTSFTRDGPSTRRRGGSGFSPLGVLAAAAWLWALRRRTRAPLAAFLFFVGSLFPVLGFVNLYGARYSWVWDHWQYLADLGPIALAAVGIAAAWSHAAPHFAAPRARVPRCADLVPWRPDLVPLRHVSRRPDALYPEPRAKPGLVAGAQQPRLPAGCHTRRQGPRHR